ncbi:MAG: hypothetical protein WC716_16690 [Chitinophagaceae bacterium]|jgi:hypothetical protein
MAEKIYFFRASRTRFKIRKGKRAINPSTMLLEAFPPIDFIVERPSNADIGVPLKSIVDSVNKKLDLDGNGVVTEKEVETVLTPFVRDGKIFTSRADLMRRTRTKTEYAEAAKVEILTEQVAKLKAELEEAKKVRK